MEDIELFVHCQGQRPKKATAANTDRLADVLARVGVTAPEALVFIGESAEALEEDADADDGEDEHEPADPNRTIQELKIRNHDHVHCHKCKRIAVEVNYSSRTKRHKFSPATTIESVTLWAKKKCKLDDASAADLVLQKCGTTERPRPNQHLGEVVDPGSCKICFDLVKEVTPQG